MGVRHLSVSGVAACLSKLKAVFATSSPSENTPAHDLLASLILSLEHYVELQLETEEALNHPSSRARFLAWLHNLYKGGIERRGVLQIMTVHASKGGQWHTVYLLQPSLIPLPDRILQGGWQAYEEGCIAYVAASRAQKRLLKLVDLEETGRAGMLSLWEPPEDTMPLEEHFAPLPAELGGVEADGGDGATQETEDAHNPAEAESEAARVRFALGALELTKIPDTQAALNAVVRKLMMRVHPDKNLGSPEATSRSQEVIKARGILLAQIQATAAAQLNQ